MLSTLEAKEMSEENLSFLREQVRTLERKNEQLVSDNGGQRDEIRDLKQKLETAQGKVSELENAQPKEGQRVLSKAENERFEAFESIGLKPDEIKTRLDQADKDRRSVIETSNKTALAKLGLKPGVVRLREFDGVSIAVEGSGDDLKATVKEGESEMAWSEWVKSKDLESDLKDFGLEPAEPDSVPALGQVGSGEKPGLKTQQQREGELRKEISI